jgi:quercetin dioxygenase-like cupin family protein
MHSASSSKIASTLIAVIGAGFLYSADVPVSFSEEVNPVLPKGFETTPLLKGSQTASGMKLEYPRTDKAEIVSVTGVMEPGGWTALHQHPVPVFVYVLEGSITVKAEGGEPRVYQAGQAFLEDVNHWHQGFNQTDKPAKILVVFMGEVGKPTTIAAK